MLKIRKIKSIYDWEDLQELAQEKGFDKTFGNMILMLSTDDVTNYDGREAINYLLHNIEDYDLDIDDYSYPLILFLVFLENLGVIEFYYD